ncbi:hypothetical protein CL628_00880 [bacterium]|nr:hypothetical protein [bacterium]
MTSEVNEIVEPEGDIEIIAEEFPKHIDIDLSNRCNLRCRFCFLVSHKPEKWQQLSYDQFLKVTPLLENAKDISLFSKYEPLTCRDFIPIFNKVCEYDIETYFSTNGILLNDDIIDALVGRLTYLTVSVTGFTRESYTKNMSQDKLETVCENLVKLNAAKKVANTEYPKLRITFVGMLDMLDELCQSVDFAVKFEASEGVRMTYFKSYDENMNQYLPLNEPETVAAAVAEASAYAQSLGQLGTGGENHRRGYRPGGTGQIPLSGTDHRRAGVRRRWGLHRRPSGSHGRQFRGPEAGSVVGTGARLEGTISRLPPGIPRGDAGQSLRVLQGAGQGSRRRGAYLHRYRLHHSLDHAGLRVQAGAAAVS